MRFRKQFLLGIALAIAAANAWADADIVVDAIHQSKAQSPELMAEMEELTVKAASLLESDFSAASANTKRLLVRGASGEALEFVLSHSEQDKSGMLLWQGEYREKGGFTAKALLTVAEGRAAGTFGASQGELRLFPQGEGTHLLVEFDHTDLQSPGFEDIHDDVRQASKLVGGEPHLDSLLSEPGGDASQSQSANKNLVTVDILVAVDSRFNSNHADAKVFAQHKVNQTNQILSYSAIPVRLNLAESMVVQDTPGLEPVYQLLALTNPNDGVMDTVHAVRNGLGADIVVLLSKRSGSVCGIAQSLNPTAASAFAVVGGISQCDDTLFAHEVAHLFGADHDPAHACSNPQVQCNADGEAFAKSYAHGFVRNFAGQRAFESYATVMTYNDSSTCKIGLCMRLHAFSNPRVIDDYGFPTGTYATHDNARVIAEQAPRLAAFRAAAGPSYAQPQAGAWYNPERSGNGLSLSRGSDGSMGIVWFTYTTDGKPTWYTSSGLSHVSAGVWNSVLRRTQRNANGSVTHTVVGDMRLRFFNQNEAVFYWDFHNNGNSSDFDGAEYVRFLFGGGSSTGTYYNPAESGWGFNFDHSGSTSIATLYYFDGAGNPVWAQSVPRVGSLSSWNSYTMQRHAASGLCPSCQGQAIQRSVSSAGTMTLRMSPAAAGWVAVQSVDGSWSRGTAASPINFTRLTQP